MKRWIAKLVLFILLGAIVNVAVAWGIVQLGPGHYISLKAAQAETVFRARTYLGSHELEYSDFVAIESGVTIRSVMRVHTEYHETPCRPWSVTLEVGWPMRALFGRSYRLRGEWTDDAWTLPVIPRTTYFDWTYQSELPLRPIWLGFAINTIFYAVIVCVMWLSPFAARRVIRRRRGHCIKCGYDLRGAEHEVCPECGS